MNVEQLTPQSTSDEVREAVKTSIYKRMKDGMNIAQAAQESHKIANERTGKINV